MRRRKDLSLRPVLAHPELKRSEAHSDWLGTLGYACLLALTLAAAAAMVYLNIGSELGESCSVIGALVAASSGQLFTLFMMGSLCSNMLCCLTRWRPLLTCMQLRKVTSWICLKNAVSECAGAEGAASCCWDAGVLLRSYPYYMSPGDYATNCKLRCKMHGSHAGGV